MMSTIRNVTLVPPGQGHAVWLVTDLVEFKATGETTGGAYALAEVTVPPQGGPPPHVHSREDEAFYILEGQFEFLAGEKTVSATAGSFISAPRGIPHTFKNVGSTPGKMLLIATPAGFEKFAMELGIPATDRSAPPAGPPDIGHLMEVCRRYGIEILLPPGG